MTTTAAPAQSDPVAQGALAHRPAGRIPALDGWRGIAILLVLLDHATTGAFGKRVFGMIGQHGVTIFFVLSGYLITSKLLEEFRSTGRLNLKNFYVRRFMRLMPAAWLFLAVIHLESSLSGGPFSRRELLGCLFFFRNYVPPGPSMTEHFWSLSLEEQFYLVWPTLLLLLGFKRSRYIAAVAAAAIAAYRFSHRGALVLLPLEHSFRSQYRADALLIGCVAALILPALSEHFRAWMIWPMLACLGLCFFRYQRIIPAGESVLIALLLHTTSLYPKTITGAGLRWKGLVYLGTISYSLYLWQQPFLETPVAHPVEMIGKVALAFAFATISYHWLEAPLVQLGHKLTRRDCIEATADRRQWLSPKFAAPPELP